MTVEVTTSRVVYVGDGDTGPFSIPFYFIDNADIKAIKVTIADGTEDALVLDTDFTLDGEGDEDGGTLTLTDALSSDYRLVIYRDPDPLQETRYPRNDPFPSESHERVADLLTMIVQRVRSLVTRGLRQPDGDADDIEALPAKATRASKYLAFDVDGHPIATSGTTESAVISSFAETLLDDETASAFLTTLGFSSYFQTLVNDADAATARSTLGLGTMATQNASAVAITGGSLAGVTLTNPAYTDQTLTDAATINWDMSSGAIATVTLADNRTMAAPTNLKKGTYILHVIQDGTGGRTLTWNAVFKWIGGVTPTLSSGANDHDVFTFVCDGTNLYGSFMPDVS